MARDDNNNNFAPAPNSLTRSSFALFQTRRAFLFFRTRPSRLLNNEPQTQTSPVRLIALVHFSSVALYFTIYIFLLLSFLINPHPDVSWLLLSLFRYSQPQPHFHFPVATFVFTRRQHFQLHSTLSDKLESAWPTAWAQIQPRTHRRKLSTILKCNKSRAKFGYDFFNLVILISDYSCMFN